MLPKSEHTMSTTRRAFLQKLGGLGAGIAGFSLLGFDSFAAEAPKRPFFKLSLAQWSLHKALFSKTKTLPLLLLRLPLPQKRKMI